MTPHHVYYRYTGVGKTNMAVVQVRMISGWTAEPASLKKLLKTAGTRLKLRRYDVEKNNDVQLYFDEVSFVRSAHHFYVSNKSFSHC